MLSKEEIQNLAQLARLELKDNDIEQLQKDIPDILAYVGQISEVQATAEGRVKPAHYNVLREDVPRAEDDLLAGKEEAILAELPRREGNYAVVRKILDK